MELLHRPWLPAAIAGEALAASEARRHRVTGLFRGDRAAVRLRFAADDHDARTITFASRPPHPDAEAQEVLRQKVRNSLGVEPERPAFLLSSMECRRTEVGAMLAGLGSSSSRPLLLVTSRDTHTTRRLADRHGCADLIRFIGATRRIDAALAACDAALCPTPDRDAGGSGRLLADALRSARPVVAHPQAPGAGLLKPSHFGTPPIGIVVESPTPTGWTLAIDAASRADWLSAAKAAARDAGAALTMEAMLKRLEFHLGRVRRDIG
jgi:glycosyltransferase involved in cell wall biosynthesis